MGGEVRLGSVVLLVLFATGGDCLKERRNTSADILAWQALQAPFPSHQSRKPSTLEIASLATMVFDNRSGFSTA